MSVCGDRVNGAVTRVHSVIVSHHIWGVTHSFPAVSMKRNEWTDGYRKKKERERHL